MIRPDACPYGIVLSESYKGSVKLSGCGSVDGILDMRSVDRDYVDGGILLIDQNGGSRRYGHGLIRRQPLVHRS